MRSVPIGITLLMASASSCVNAQAWLPEKGTFSVGLTHSSVLNKTHYLPSGAEQDVGHTRSYVTSITASYAVSDRWLITAGVPYVKARFYGERPHFGTDIDDGDERASLTDLRLELHYQWRTGPVAIAPYLAIVQPTRSYPILGHAAPGRGLHEQWVGAFFGRSLDDWLPRTYLQGRVNYAFVERVVGIHHDRSNADLELGHFFSPKWSARILVSWHDTHGGIDVPVPPSNPLYRFHDQLAEERLVQVGVGVAWSMSPNIGGYLLLRKSVSGANGHQVDSNATLGMSYAFAASDR
jgi:hypothetical protein